MTTLTTNYFEHDNLTAGRPAVATDAERHRAARYVASRARDAQDCARLLDELGLTPDDGLDPAPARDSEPAPEPAG